MGAYDKVTNVDLAPPNYLNNMTVSDYIDQFHFMQDGVIHELLAITSKFFHQCNEEEIEARSKDDQPFKNERLFTMPDDEDYNNEKESAVMTVDFFLAEWATPHCPYQHLNLKYANNIMLLQATLGVLHLTETTSDMQLSSEDSSNIKVKLMKLADRQKTTLECFKNLQQVVFNVENIRKGERAFGEDEDPLVADIRKPDQRKNPKLYDCIERYIEKPAIRADDDDLQKFSYTKYQMKESRDYKICMYVENKYGKGVNRSNPLKALSKNTLKSLATAAGGVGVGALGTYYGVMSGGRKSKKNRKYTKRKKSRKRRKSTKKRKSIKK
jgi:hypothetical protein